MHGPWTPGCQQQSKRGIGHVVAPNNATPQLKKKARTRSSLCDAHRRRRHRGPSSLSNFLLNRQLGVGGVCRSKTGKCGGNADNLTSPHRVSQALRGSYRQPKSSTRCVRRCSKCTQFDYCLARTGKVTKQRKDVLKCLEPHTGCEHETPPFVARFSSDLGGSSRSLAVADEDGFVTVLKFSKKTQGDDFGPSARGKLRMRRLGLVLETLITCTPIALFPPRVRLFTCAAAHPSPCQATPSGGWHIRMPFST